MKMAGSRQSYCRNKQAYFFGPHCSYFDVKRTLSVSVPVCVAVLLAVTVCMCACMASYHWVILTMCVFHSLCVCVSIAVSVLLAISVCMCL